MAYASSGVSDANRTYALRLIGSGVSARVRRIVGRSYYDLGNAPLSSRVAGIGSLSAAYSKNYATGLNISFRWERMNRVR
jgi:hypothetical protein